MAALTDPATDRPEGVDLPRAAPVQRPFFPAIESLRGIGTLSVAGYHLSGWAPHGMVLLPMERPWANVGALQNGIGHLLLAFLSHAPLMVFFVISGFVLRVSLQHGPQDFGKAAARFHIARFFRLYPVVIAGMLFAACAYGWQLPASPGRPATPLSASTLLANLALINVSLNPTLWAIQIEVLVAPALVLLYFLERRLGVRALAAVAVATSLMSFGNWALWRPLSTHFFAFVFGMLIPTVGKHFAERLSRVAANRLLICAVLALLLPGQLFGFYSRYTSFIEGYAAVLLVALVAYRMDLSVGRLLNARVTRQLGLTSASIYTFHMPFCLLIVLPIAFLIPVEVSGRVPALTGPLVIVAGLLALIPVAALSYRLIEAPGIAMGHWINRRLGLQTAAPRAA